MTTAYVLGLAFPLNKQQVVLMRKSRPAWQKGRLNAPGGKIEPGESAVAAMAREFFEETGVKTLETDWDMYARLTGTDFDVTVFRLFSDAVLNVRMAEDQAVELHDIHGPVVLGDEPISNVRWLVFAALDPDQGVTNGHCVIAADYTVGTNNIS